MIIMWLLHVFTMEKTIENVVKLLGCGIFDFFLEILWKFNNVSLIRRKALKTILDILETLKGENVENERAFLLKKMTEFNFERLFDEIMEGVHDDNIPYLVGQIRRNLQ